MASKTPATTATAQEQATEYPAAPQAAGPAHIFVPAFLIRQGNDARTRRGIWHANGGGNEAVGGHEIVVAEVPDLVANADEHA